MLATALLIASIQSDMSSLKTYRSQILPSTAESRFEEIGWKPTMWSAVVEAQSKDPAGPVVGDERPSARLHVKQWRHCQTVCLE